MRAHHRPRAWEYRAGPLVVALVFSLAASCTSEPERRDLPDVDIDESAAPTIDAPSAGPTPTVASEVAGLPGRLAILNAAGDLVTMDPDGSDELVLDEVEAGRSQVRQPTWSPDGRSVGWVHLEITEAGALSAAVATSTGDGTRPTERRTAVVPFYLSWDPTSSRIAYLGSPSETAIELGILELAGRSAGTPIDTGQPFYISWGPDGDQLLVHVGDDRLERLDLDGSLTTVAERPGTFSAPVWTADGRTFVYASIDAGDQRLVVRRRRGRDGTDPRPVRRVDRLRRESRAASGSRSRSSSPGARSRSRSSTSIPAKTVEITGSAIASFFWSPDGERLLYLDPESRDGEQLWFRWGVWDGTSSFLTPRFVPSELIAVGYLQFFEQYAQSMSLWSPDSSAFAYPGMNEDGEEGIWIQSARPDRAAVLVADGDFVAWSPV